MHLLVFFGVRDLLQKVRDVGDLIATRSVAGSWTVWSEDRGDCFGPKRVARIDDEWSAKLVLAAE